MLPFHALQKDIPAISAEYITGSDHTSASSWWLRSGNTNNNNNAGNVNTSGDLNNNNVNNNNSARPALLRSEKSGRYFRRPVPGDKGI